MGNDNDNDNDNDDNTSEDIIVSDDNVDELDDNIFGDDDFFDDDFLAWPTYAPTNAPSCEDPRVEMRGKRTAAKSGSLRAKTRKSRRNATRNTTVKKSSKSVWKHAVWLDSENAASCSKKETREN